MGVVGPPLHPELDVTQLGVVDELGVDAGRRRLGARRHLAPVIHDPLDARPAEAR